MSYNLDLIKFDDRLPDHKKIGPQASLDRSDETGKIEDATRNS